MSSMLEFQNICKYFPGVKALDNISFKAYAGEVLAFLGENGAGKSTLLKVLNGDYQPTSGKYLLDGVEKHFQSPHQAIEEGISVIYQERQILLELSVAENIYLGRMPVNRFGFIDTQKANQMASKIIEDFGLPIHPSTKVKDLSIAYQQMVEIMKAYSRENLKVICFDEPTASLSDSEIDALFKIIAKLKAEGKIIIYVSHRMEEIQRITDKVAIFKDGHYVTTVKTGEVPESEMIRMMVGRDLGDIYKNLDRNKEIGEVLLEVKNVSSDYVKENSFVLRKGEVLGFSGLVGAGRTELMRAISGADPIRSGEIILEGKKIQNRSPHEAMEHGIVLVPEDRKLQGILSNLDISDNINISMLDKNSNSLGFVDAKKEEKIAEDGIKNFKIKTPSAKKKIVELRKQLIKNAYLLLFLSQGVPLLMAGDEFGNSQDGNNNAYCQDNAVSWSNWKLLETHKDQVEFVKRLIAFRKSHKMFHMDREPRIMDYKSCGRPDVSYHGENAWKPEFENFRRQFGILYWGAYAKKPDGTDDANFYVLYNMHWEPHMFGLPHLPKGAKWHVICSTADPDVEDLPSDGTGEVLKNQMMLAVPPRGIMILESVADPDAGKETKKGKSGSKKEKNEKTDLVEKSCEKEEKSTPENGKEL